MKQLIALCLTSLLSLSVYAERNSLITHEDEWMMFSRFDLKLTTIDEDDTFLGGLSFGGLMNDKFILGLGGNILVDDAATGRNEELKELSSTDFWYAGLYTGYIFNPEDLINVSLDVLIGGGQIEAEYVNQLGRAETSVFVIEPSLNVKLNITETFSIGASGSYRWIEHSGIPGFEDADFSDPAVSLYFHFTQE